jgi:hypothetical protein
MSKMVMFKKGHIIWSYCDSVLMRLKINKNKLDPGFAPPSPGNTTYLIKRRKYLGNKNICICFIVKNSFNIPIKAH